MLMLTLKLNYNSINSLVQQEFPVDIRIIRPNASVILINTFNTINTTNTINTINRRQQSESIEVALNME